MTPETEERGASVIPGYPDLSGKVAVVTGGSRGIGAATCRLLAANGVKVAVNGRNEAAIGTVRRSGSPPTSETSPPSSTCASG